MTDTSDEARGNIIQRLSDAASLECRAMAPGWEENADLLRDAMDRIAALEAEVARLERERFSVKPLEWWEPRDRNNWTHGARTFFGTYYVAIDGGRHTAFTEIFHEGEGIEQWNGPDRGSLDEAKRDAQADYESRVFSALRSTSPAPSEAAWLDMGTAPTGIPSDSVGCPDASEWFEARIAPEFKRSDGPPYVVVRRRGWPQEDSWEDVGETYFVPRYFDGWRALASEGERDG